MRVYVFAIKDNKGNFIYETDNFNTLSDNQRKKFNNSYLQLVYMYVKSRLKNKGELLNEKI